MVADRVVELARERAQGIAEQAGVLREALSALPGPPRGRHAFVDLALGAESHVKRHLVRLAAAERRIFSYVEIGDITAIDRAVAAGFPVLRRIARSAADRGVDHRVVFGFTYRTAPALVDFLRSHRNDLEHVTGIRYAGELGHPFHVVDDDTVILPLDHPFVPEGPYASLLVRDADLARCLTEGFETLWRKAMHDLREIDFHPRGAEGR